MHTPTHIHVYIKISWARAFAYPYTERTDPPKHSQKQTTLHMHAQTWAYSHSLTGSCVLFVRNPLHLFLPSRLTKACLSLGTLTHARTLSLFWCVIMCSSTNTCSPYINQTTHNPLGWTGSLHSDAHTSLSKSHKSRRTLWRNLILYSGRVMRDFVTLAIIVSCSLYTHGHAPWSLLSLPDTRTQMLTVGNSVKWLASWVECYGWHFHCVVVLRSPAGPLVQLAHWEIEGVRWVEVPEREGLLREKEREKDTGLLQLHWILISSLGSVNELEKNDFG